MEYIPNKLPCELPDKTLRNLDKLHLIQKTMFEILVVIDHFCRQHEIQYFLYYGTLLGAVRHHGFIPWDDDADICMLRKDYDRFIRLWSKEETGLDLECYKTDPTTRIPYAKIRMPGTEIHEKYDTSKRYYGIWVDVFPLDGYSDLKLIRKIEVFVTSSLCRVLIPVDWAKRSWKGKLQSIVLYALRLFYLMSPSFYQSLLQKWLSRYNSNSRLLGDCCDLNRSIVSAGIFNKVIYMRFNGVDLACPKEYDKWLHLIYGKYMELPSIEARVPSHII